MNRFIDILRDPDNIKIMTEDTPFRFEEGAANEVNVKLDFAVKHNALFVIIEPTTEKVKWIRLRWHGDFSKVRSVWHDGFERGDHMYVADTTWSALRPQEMMPWNFAVLTLNNVLHCYGVKTGVNSFCYFQCDRSGITLWIDVTNGSGGFSPKEPFVATEIVCQKGVEGEIPYRAMQKFCKVMCDKPNLPKEPVFGFNNWYWAYGKTNQDEVLNEAKFLSSLCSGDFPSKPYMVMDDGWQIDCRKGYNGGPWDRTNDRFPSMQKMAEDINKAGCKAGVWIRPLLTHDNVPDEAIYKSNFTKNGNVLDPSHPYTIQKVSQDISRIHDWGFDLIKHDFTTTEIFGRGNIPTLSWPGMLNPLDYPAVSEMFDQTRTNAQIIRDFYRAIQNAAKGSVVIGCNTIGHLVSGIHEVQRVGNDTSGRVYELTVRNGIHAMMRMPQNETFFRLDADCAAFTDMVPAKFNLDFLEAMAITGTTTFASVSPGILKEKEAQRMSEIFRIAATIKPSGFATVEDWDRTSAPAEFMYCGKLKIYDWWQHYDGARLFMDWFK